MIHRSPLAALGAALVLTLPALAAPAPGRADEGALAKATAAFRAGEYTRVLEAAAAAGEDAPERPKLLYLAGEAQLVLGRPADAEASFRGVLAARPQAIPAEVGLGRALTRQGGEARAKEAEKLLRGVLAGAPKEVAAKAALGELLASTGRVEAAQEELAGALALAPTDPFVVRSYFEVELLADAADGAAAAAEAFAAARPDHPLGYFLLAVVMERDGEDGLAVEQYEAALERDPNYLDAHKNLAILCHTLSDSYQDKARTQLAYDHYARYFELGGSDPRLKAMYAELVRYKDQILGS